MRKIKRNFLIILIIAVTIFSALVFVGCKKTFLSIPVLKLNAEEKKVEWDAIANAKEYLINVYKGEKADKQLLLFTTQQDKTYHLLSNYSEIITIGVSCLGYGNFNSSSQKLIVINISKMSIVDSDGGGDDLKDENETNEPIIITDVVKSLNNIFYSKSELLYDRDVKVQLDDKVTKLEAFELKTNHWTFDDKTNILTIKAKYFSSFSVGAKPEFVATFQTAFPTKFYVQVVSELPYEIRQSNDIDTQGKLLFAKSDSLLGVSMKLYDESGKQMEFNPVIKLCIDGKETTYDWVGGAGFNTISVKKEVLDEMSVGKHSLQIFSSRGKSEVALFIESTINLAPNNLWVDFESNYPYSYLKWETRNSEDKNEEDVIVTINNKVYARSDSLYEEYFLQDCLELNSLLLPSKNLTITVATKIGGNLYTSSELLYENNVDTNLVKYFTTMYDYFGKKINSYLRNSQEAQELINYIILNYDSLDAYTGSKLDDKGKPYKKKIDIYFEQGPDELLLAIKEARLVFPEAVSWYSAVVYKESNQKEITFCCTMRSTVNPNLTTASPTCGNEEKNNDTNFGEGLRKLQYSSYEQVPFKIMSNSNFALVKSTTELVMALERDLRPRFMTGSIAEKTFISAKKVLYEIIDDKMSDYQKVTAIFEWLGNNVIYDYKIALRSEELSPIDDRYIDLYHNKAFFAEGVFQNNLAVCNGIAQAFVIMCRIEGIKAYKISGKANGGAHAWNKVIVDNIWYICDPTWANKAIDYNGDFIEDSEVLSHNTLFMTTQSSGAAKEHAEDDKSSYKKYYAGDTNYNFYANLFYKDANDSYFEFEKDENGKVKNDSDGNPLRGAINDLIFDSKKQASQYILSETARKSDYDSFIISFIIIVPKDGSGSFDDTFSYPKNYTSTHFAKRKLSIAGQEVVEGQMYQYGVPLFKISDYLLYIIKLKKV